MASEIAVRLVGCPSREVAAHYRFAEDRADDGPELASRTLLPLFWLAGFGIEDTLVVRVPCDDDPSRAAREFIVLCAPASQIVERLRRRRAAVLALLPACFDAAYDAWTGFLAANYLQQLLLRTEELFEADGDRRAGLRLQAALRFLAVADDGRRVRERAAIDWLTAAADAFRERWPGEEPAHAVMRWRTVLAGFRVQDEEPPVLSFACSATELAFAAAVPQADTAADPATPEGEAQALTEAVRHGVSTDSAAAGLRLAAVKLAGNVPLGVDAPTRGLRRLIGGGGELLNVVRSAFVGLAAAVLGAGFVWAGALAGPDWRLLGLGALLIAASGWLLRGALRALRKLRAILRA